MSLLFISESEIERDIFQLGLQRLRSDIFFHAVTDCQSAIKLLNDLAVKPDFVVLDADSAGCEVGKCLSMLKCCLFIGTSTIIAYSDSIDPKQIAFMLSEGAKSHLYKSRSFAVFCHDLSLLLEEKQTPDDLLVAAS